MTIDQMLKDKDLIQEGDALYLPPFYYAETGTAVKLLKLAAQPAGDKLWTRLTKQ
jgi:exodeoxyribonuclease V alpha subunit